MGRIMEYTESQLKAPIEGAPNFTLWELIRSDTAIRLGINNIPTDADVVRNLELLARNALQPCRNALGATYVSSGYRGPNLNAAVGGSPTSWHSYGKAADITVAGVPLWTVFTWFYDNIPCIELIAEELPNGWIHVAYSDTYNGKAVTKYKLRGGPVRKASYAEIEAIFKKQGLI